jgi:hypothetical protein
VSFTLKGNGKLFGEFQAEDLHGLVSYLKHHSGNQVRS